MEWLNAQLHAIQDDVVLVDKYANSQLACSKASLRNFNTRWLVFSNIFTISESMMFAAVLLPAPLCRNIIFKSLHVFFHHAMRMKRRISSRHFALPH